MLVYQRVNLHFPMVFLWFSHGFRMVFPLKPPLSQRVNPSFHHFSWSPDHQIRQATRKMLKDRETQRLTFHAVKPGRPGNSWRWGGEGAAGDKARLP